MKLVAAVESYIALRRSLGSVFAAESRILRCFGSSLGDICLEGIDPQVCRHFCRGGGVPPRWWERKHYALRDFFACLVSRGHLRTAPARAAVPSMKSKNITPHTIRRTAAVRLLHAGVDINTIRAWLGHVSLETTNRYAPIDLETKAAALKFCAIQVDTSPQEYSTPLWHRSNDIMAFLKTL